MLIIPITSYKILTSNQFYSNKDGLCRIHKEIKQLKVTITIKNLNCHNSKILKLTIKTDSKEIEINVIFMKSSIH